MIPWMIYVTKLALRVIDKKRLSFSFRSNKRLVYPLRLGSVHAGKMVKLGNNFSEKNNGKVVSEDGFDTIPLITPLDASQLQFPPPDKVRICIWYSPLIWRVTVRGLYRTDPYSIFHHRPIRLLKMKKNPTLNLLWTRFLMQLYLQADWVIFFMCVHVCCVSLPGGGEDKGRLRWWEQEGKATIS